MKTSINGRLARLELTAKLVEEDTVEYEARLNAFLDFLDLVFERLEADQYKAQGDAFHDALPSVSFDSAEWSAIMDAFQLVANDTGLTTNAQLVDKNAFYELGPRTEEERQWWLDHLENMINEAE